MTGKKLTPKLTDKQKKFCEYYAASGNGQASAIKAGYSKKTAAAMANENLNKPYVAAYLATLAEPSRNKRIANIEERYELLTAILRNVANSDEIKTNDRLKALDLLNKMEGVYVEKIEVADVTDHADLLDKRISKVEQLRNRPH